LKTWRWSIRSKIKGIPDHKRVQVVKGKLKVGVQMQDPEELFWKWFPVLVECDVTALSIQWDALGGILSLNWRCLMDKYCAAIIEAEARAELRKRRENWAAFCFWKAAFVVFAVAALMVKVVLAGRR
jgi:hypothetical protein